MLGFHLLVCFLVLETSQLALVLKNLFTSARDTGSVSGLGRFPGEGNGNPLQYSWLENPKDRGVWWAIVHGLQRAGHDQSDLAITHLHIKETQGDQTSQSWRKSTLNIYKNWCWGWSSNTLSTWCEEPTHWKRPWCWERLRAGGEGDDRSWGGWMTSLTQYTWVWANSGDNEEQGSLECCSPWDLKESDMT